MLVIEDNSVYEIDEECIRKKQVPEECGTCEKLRKQQKKDHPNSAKSMGEKPFYKE